MTNLSFWGNMATLLLIVEICTVMAVTGLILFLSRKGIGWLITNLPTYTGQGLSYAKLVRTWTQRICRQIAMPFALAHGLWAGIRRAWHVLR